MLKLKQLRLCNCPPCKHVDWDRLPDVVIDLILAHYKDGLHFRMVLRELNIILGDFPNKNLSALRKGMIYNSDDWPTSSSKGLWQNILAFDDPWA